MSIIDRGVIEIDPVVTFSWHNAGEAILVDIREDDEWSEAHIPGTLLIPMSDFDAKCFPRWSGKRLKTVACTLVWHGKLTVYNPRRRACCLESFWSASGVGLP